MRGKMFPGSIARCSQKLVKRIPNSTSERTFAKLSARACRNPTTNRVVAFLCTGSWPSHRAGRRDGFYGDCDARYIPTTAPRWRFGCDGACALAPCASPTNPHSPPSAANQKDDTAIFLGLRARRRAGDEGYGRHLGSRALRRGTQELSPRSRDVQGLHQAADARRVARARGTHVRRSYREAHEQG